jgi:hypothetical protein
VEAAPRHRLPGFEHYEAFYRSQIRSFVSEAEAKRRHLLDKLQEKRQAAELFNRGLRLCTRTAYLLAVAVWVIPYDDLRSAEFSIDLLMFLVGGGILLLSVYWVAVFLCVLIPSFLIDLIRQIPADRALDQHGWEFNNELVKRLCSFFALSFEPEYDSNFPIDRFEQLGLVDGKVLGLEDHVFGKHEGVLLQVVEARIFRKKDDGHYRQLLLSCSFPKNFSGVTRVLSDIGAINNRMRRKTEVCEHAIEQIGGPEGRHAQPLDQRVKLEDPRFERRFEVYSTDQVEARYLLTPTFMERVVALNQLLGAKRVELAFAANTLHVAYLLEGDFLSLGSMEKTLHDRSRIDHLLDELGLMFMITDTLKLSLPNTRSANASL